MSTFVDWWDSNTATVNEAVEKAQNEVELARREGMSRGQVLQHTNQIIAAQQAGDAESVLDVYNVVAEWRRGEGKRRDSPANPVVDAQAVTDFAEKKATDVAKRTQEAARIIGRDLKDNVSDLVAGTTEAVVGGAARGVSAGAGQFPWWVGPAAAVGGTVVAVAALALLIGRARS